MVLLTVCMWDWTFWTSSVLRLCVLCSFLLSARGLFPSFKTVKRPLSLHTAVYKNCVQWLCAHKQNRGFLYSTDNVAASCTWGSCPCVRCLSMLTLLVVPVNRTRGTGSCSSPTALLSATELSLQKHRIVAKGRQEGWQRALEPTKTCFGFWISGILI